jgi:hypothetical protein
LVIRFVGDESKDTAETLGVRVGLCLRSQAGGNGQGDGLVLFLVTVALRP